MEEKVLVFSNELLQDFVDLPGVSKSVYDVGTLFRTCLPQAYFIDRARAETDESVVQVIPYIVIQYRHLYATYRRTKKGGEDRLHNKYSIGLGGHINLDDLTTGLSTPQDLIHGAKSCQELAFAHAARREIFEEIKWASDITGKPYMLIYDNKDAVGRVHLGVVMVMQPKSIPEEVQTEEEIDNFSWKSKGKLQRMEDELEGWSRLCLPHI